MGSLRDEEFHAGNFALGLDRSLREKGVHPMKRREFLKNTVVLANAAAFGGLTDGAQQASAPCPVTLLPMPDYGRDMEKEIAAIMAGDGLALKGKKVLLKPNFVEAHPERPINTNPVRYRRRGSCLLASGGCSSDRRRGFGAPAGPLVFRPQPITQGHPGQEGQMRGPQPRRCRGRVQ